MHLLVQDQREANTPLLPSPACVIDPRGQQSPSSNVRCPQEAACSNGDGGKLRSGLHHGRDERMDQVQVRVISKVPVPQRIQEFRGQETGEPRELSAVVLSQIRIMDPHGSRTRLPCPWVDQLCQTESGPRPDHEPGCQQGQIAVRAGVVLVQVAVEAATEGLPRARASMTAEGHSGPKAVTSSSVTPSPGRLLRLTTQVHFVPIVSRLPCMCGRDRYGACAASRILSGEIRAGTTIAREIIWSTSASDVTERDPKQTDLMSLCKETFVQAVSTRLLIRSISAGAVLERPLPLTADRLRTPLCQARSSIRAERFLSRFTFTASIMASVSTAVRRAASFETIDLAVRSSDAAPAAPSPLNRIQGPLVGSGNGGGAHLEGMRCRVPPAPLHGVQVALVDARGQARDHETGASPHFRIRDVGEGQLFELGAERRDVRPPLRPPVSCTRRPGAASRRRSSSHRHLRSQCLEGGMPRIVWA